ncbi:hypothetical protein [Actinoplanes sp. NPDC051851]|uniref:hypothetical protein n=1 Tax=Actinoplanes sp. NPDC051851 TaxID=3154753 RepID=UPI00343F4562
MISTLVGAAARDGEKQIEQNVIRRRERDVLGRMLIPFARNLASWRSTAEAWSDPQLARELQGPFDGDGPTLDRPAGNLA